jgi:hypothetical protein
MDTTLITAEHARLDGSPHQAALWKRFGPYLSERQWGTVREDYSAAGTGWDYLPHEQARSRTYRWGEDGLAGICDDRCRMCLGVVLWNGRDRMLKERLFGLNNAEGNHGEDVKELYYYLDATPTSSYLKMLYKYPQGEFPYDRLVEENRRRTARQPEYELFDTGLFDQNRYFDVFVEYAKAAPDDILMRITIHNRGPAAAALHVLPQLWFRNTWSWKEPDSAKPVVQQLPLEEPVAVAWHRWLGDFYWQCPGARELLFCDNETNEPLLFDTPREGYFKDAFHDYVIDGRREAVNPQRIGTKAAALHELTIPPGASATVRTRLSKQHHADSLAEVDGIFDQRIREADDFYGHLQQGLDDPDACNIQRQAFAGMLWSKQFYYYDVPEWINGDPLQPPPPPERQKGRNHDWLHLNNADIISMPDKWEYPWYAAWDLAFHCLPLALVDAEFAKEQLILLTREWYMHPNGQLPAYEWAFGDVNPPVHAWATWRVFQMDRKQRGGHGDLAFLERVFHKLMLNFTWWVNRKDAEGRNLFQGGFLGLDNIGIFDRSRPLPMGGRIDQADGTSWMAMYCLNLMRIALELALHNPVYEDIATKFFEHFLHIAEAMTNMGGEGVGLWDDDDSFYYDQLHLPGGEVVPQRVRSMVGLIPLFAVETLEPEMLERLPDFHKRLKWFLRYRPELANLVSRWEEPGKGERRLLSLLRGHRMKRLLRRMLDETEFLSDYGIRATSKVHEKAPYEFRFNGDTLRVGYEPAESTSRLFGGNSNWRGPIWFPVNYLIIESLQKFHHYYGNDFKVECPTGSGQYLTIEQIAEEISRRLVKIFQPDASGVRPVFRHHGRFAADPHFRDHLLFYEYFHGDNGRGVGASHQTGWTGLVAKLLMPRRHEH